MNDIKELAKLIRYYCLKSTSAAGSGHPTSSLSAADLLATLWFGSSEGGFFHFDFGHPDNPFNDRMIFSKGHASPLYYSLFLAADVITSGEIMTLRQFDSRLEGHPTPRFPFTEAATGSLGQGLSVGVGMALAQKKQNSTDPRIPMTYVLLGDGEMAEGSVWEAANSAAYFKLNNLVAIVDVNRLGQSQETMHGWDTDTYQKKFEAFGWDVIVIDGHNYGEIMNAFLKMKSRSEAAKTGKPFAIIAKTVKGKGISFLENKEGWHGKALPPEELEKAIKELRNVNLKLRGKVEKPQEKAGNHQPEVRGQVKLKSYKVGDSVATRKAYGEALADIGVSYLEVVALDAEVKNSSYAEIFKNKFPDRFFEMFIAEQNMVGVAGGLAKRGFIPFVSTFACFLTRAFDQIRMAALSEFNVKFVGSHAGVSIGEDGPSQMGLEDIAMFRAIYGSTIFYPADAVATANLVSEMVKNKGIFYLRTTRGNTPVIYPPDEKFQVGGSKIHKLDNKNKKTKNQKILIVAAGITLFEALKAQEELYKSNIEAIVLDVYSIKPIDRDTLSSLADQVEVIITVEDHWSEGGLGDAVLEALSDKKVPVHKLAVSKMPRSGKPAELLAYEEIDSKNIFRLIVGLFE